MIDHIITQHATYGPVPLCGAAMWGDLVTEEQALNDEENVCWECASICGWDVSRVATTI